MTARRRAVLPRRAFANIRNLQADDVEALLAFELANRSWFEQHVEARDPGFYSPAGVAAHIADYLASHAAGNLHPCVLISADGATIIGRANLRQIDRASGTAEVGYRIAQDQTGQGLASLALTHLQQAARTHYGLRQLCAWVSEHNPGSQGVLQKCGFTRDVLTAPEVAQVNGADHATHRYHCHL